MPKKPKEAQPYLSTEGGAVPAPVRRKRTRARVKGGAVPQPSVEAAQPQHATAAAASNQVPLDPIAEREEIARLAYSLWEARGRQGGSPEEDWFRAEQEILKRRAGATC
ncbi:MAG: DUF2934 domain-containing protein [Rhodospirillales bacterium]